MASYIAHVYADLIRKGNKTIEDVPERLKKDVEEILNTEEGANNA